MAVPFQPTQFQPVSFYDKPGIILQQILDDEVTAQGIWNTVTKDALLSPAERNSYADELKKKIGANDPFTKTAVDLVTNPFVWLAALVTPVGGSSLKAGGTLFSGSKMGVAIREKTPWLMGMGLLGGNPVLRGSPSAYVLSQISQARDNFLKQMTQAGIAEQKLLKSLEKKWNRKVKSIDPRVHSGKEFEQELKDINAAIWARLNDNTTIVSEAELAARAAAGFVTDTKKIVVSNPQLKREVEVFKGFDEHGNELWVGTKKSRDAIPEAFRNADEFTKLSPAKDIELEAIKYARTGASGPGGSKIRARDVAKGEKGQIIYTVSDGGDGVPYLLNKPMDEVKELIPDQHFRVTANATGLRTVEQRVGSAVESNRWANKTNVDRIVEEYGLDEYINATREQLDGAFLKLFAKDKYFKEGTTASQVMREYRLGSIEINDLLDQNKIKRLWRSSSTPVVRERFYNPLTGKTEETTTGVKLIADFFPDAEKSFTKIADFEKSVGLVFETHLRNGEYFPSGLRELVDGNGRNIINKGNPKEVQQAIAAGLTIPRGKTTGPAMWHPDDLETMHRLAQGDEDAVRYVEHMERNLHEELLNLKGTEGAKASLGVRRLNPHRAMTMYMDRAATTYALHIAGTGTDDAGRAIYHQGLWQNIDDLQVKWGDDIRKRDGKGTEVLKDSYHTDTRFMKNESWVRGPEQKIRLDGSATGRRELRDFLEEQQRFGNEPSAPAGGYNMADVLNQTYEGAAVADTFTKSALKDILIPRITGRKTLVEMTDRTLTEYTRTMARGFVESPLGALLNKQGGRWGKNLYEDLRAWSDLSRTGEAPGQVAGTTAAYLYTTHLGVNPASVLLNITQPWLHGASWLGAGAVAKGYINAFKELSGYMTERISKGINITPEEKIGLIEKHFTHAKPGNDMLGIKPDLYETLESITFAGQGGTPRGPVKQALFDWPMKGFEKGEWLNRLVMAHATDHAYRSAGRWADSGPLLRERLRTTKSMVEETQFGGNVMNTPLIFLGHTGAGAPLLGSWTTSPLARQFLTFPTRTITGFAHTSRELGEGARQLRGGMNIPQFPGMATTADFIRGLGISSVLYYAGKNFLGGDISRSLLANASTDLFGGDDFLYSKGEWDWVPVPPAYDIGLQGFRSIFTDDAETLKMQLARVVPGGVELSRALGVQKEGLGLPDPFKGLVSSLQRTYADYTHTTPDGYVPFYKGDGTFVDYRKPADLIMQGLGMDLSKSKIKGELDGYLVKQREEILKYRNEFLNAMFANDISAATKVKGEFEKRFKIPLTITKDNIRQRLRNRNVPRAERILDRIPPEARQEYTGYLAARGKEMGIDPSAFDFETPTSTSRSAEFDRPDTYNLDPETVKALKQLLNQQKKEPPVQEANYTTYVPYEWQ